jgi:hypothetical protein
MIYEADKEEIKEEIRSLSLMKDGEEMKQKGLYARWDEEEKTLFLGDDSLEPIESKEEMVDVT